MSATVKIPTPGIPAPLQKVLASPVFWTAVLVLITYAIFNKRIAAWWRKLTTPDRGHTDGHAALNEADMARVEKIAMDMRTQVSGMPKWDDQRDELAGQILAMNDTEVGYLADFYTQIADGTTLLEDVQGEWSWIGDNQARLIAKLLQLNA